MTRPVLGGSVNVTKADDQGDARSDTAEVEAYLRKLRDHLTDHLGEVDGLLRRLGVNPEIPD